MNADYWPDLSLLPKGWSITRIEWAAGRVIVELMRNYDRERVGSTRFHRTPAGAFNQAVGFAERWPT